MSALDEIDALVGIGRRAPGSDAERRAARHLEARLKRLGRPAEVEPLDVWPRWALALALSAALSLLGSVLSVSLPIPGAALALAGALLLSLEVGLLIPVARRLLGRRASQNVVSRGPRERPGLIVLVAHYDAGRGGLALVAGFAAGSELSRSWGRSSPCWPVALRGWPAWTRPLWASSSLCPPWSWRWARHCCWTWPCPPPGPARTTTHQGSRWR